MKWTSAAAGALALATTSICGTAGAVTIDGIDFQTGAALAIATIFQDQPTAVGQMFTGVGRVDSIQTPPGVITWQNGNNGRELTAVISGYQVAIIEPTSAGIRVGFTGGAINLYSDASPDFVVDSSTNGGAAPSAAQSLASAGDGNLFLSLSAAGIDTCAGSGFTTCGVGPNAAAGTAITLDALISSGTLFLINEGRSTGLLNATGGSALAFFDTNTQPNGTDFSFGSSFRQNPRFVTADNPFPISGSANLESNSVTPPPPPAVSEPATIAMLGLGVLGLAGATRRRRRAS